MQVHVDVAALVDPDLLGRDDDDAVPDAGDVGRAVDVAGDDKAPRYVLEGQAQKRRRAGGGDGHVDDAVLEVRQAARGRGPGRRGGQDNVEARVAGKVDVPRGGEAGLPYSYASARPGELLVVVLGERGEVTNSVRLVVRRRGWFPGGLDRTPPKDPRIFLLPGSIVNGLRGPRFELKLRLGSQFGEFLVQLLRQVLDDLEDGLARERRKQGIYERPYLAVYPLVIGRHKVARIGNLVCKFGQAVEDALLGILPLAADLSQGAELLDPLLEVFWRLATRRNGSSCGGSSHTGCLRLELAVEAVLGVHGRTSTCTIKGQS